METVCFFSTVTEHLNNRRHQEDFYQQVVVMSQRDVIDFSALEKELQAAVESERRYQRENDAKLRAVSQGVSYEQFRGLVLSSHLKPLDSKDKDGGPRKQPWNPVVPGNAS